MENNKETNEILKKDAKERIAGTDDQVWYNNRPQFKDVHGNCVIEGVSEPVIESENK